MTDKELMQQALEALNRSDYLGWQLNIPIIKALRERLAQPEQEQDGPICEGWQLSVADGHSGYGVYAHMEDYPEEGALLVLPIQQPEQEPVAHSIVAGALFDFMGWLTSRRERLVLSSVDDAGPAADAIKDFAQMRSLSINDAQVLEWQEHLAAPQPAQQVLEHAPCQGMNCGITRTDQEHSMECQAEHAAAIAGGTFVKPAQQQQQQQEPVALPEKIYEFVPTPEPVKWHHPECEGQCIACLIEQVVQEAYGSQGLGYLQRHLTSPPQRKPLTDEELRKLADKHLFYQPEGYEVSGMFAFARAIEAKLREKNGGGV